MQTFNGGDTANIRHSSLNLNGATVFIQEEQSLDSEISHGTEVVGYFAFDQGGIFTGGGGAFPMGRPEGTEIPLALDSSFPTDRSGFANYFDVHVTGVTLSETF